MSISVGAESHWLSVLNAFTNADKHRVIHSVVVRPTSVEARQHVGDFRIEIALPKNGKPVLTDGAHVYTLRITEPSQAYVQVKTELTYSMGFGNRALADGDLLSITVYGVGELIDRFRPIFG